MCVTKRLYLSYFYMLRSSLKLCYCIIHNDVRVIGLLQVIKVRVAEFVLINVNLYRKTQESIP